MTLRIISTTEILYEGDVQMVRLPGTQGQFTVLNNHAALASTLTPGPVTYRDSQGSEHTLDIAGGVADIARNTVAVCVY